MPADTIPSSFTLARRTARMSPSVIREILKITERPGIISLAGGLPSAETFPVEAMREANLDVQGFGSETLDGSTFGVFYHLNFPMSGAITPYLGASLATIGGDLGDVYDLEYGFSGGVKYYPFEHVGVNFGVAWSQLTGAESYIDDGDGLGLAVGLLIRF